MTAVKVGTPNGYYNISLDNTKMLFLDKLAVQDRVRIGRIGANYDCKESYFTDNTLYLLIEDIDKDEVRLGAAMDRLKEIAPVEVVSWLDSSG
jgi:hypothetical protein